MTNSDQIDVPMTKMRGLLATQAYQSNILQQQNVNTELNLTVFLSPL